MTNESLSNTKSTFDRLLAHTERSAQQFEQQLQTIDNKLQDQVGLHNDDERERLLELTLQLRIDALHTIEALMNLNTSYCQVIGIDSRNTQAQNLERLQFALGKENISNIVQNLLRLITDLESSIHLQERQLLAERKLRKRLRKLFREQEEQEQQEELEAKEEQDEEHAFRHDVPHSKIESLAILFHHAQHAQAYFHLSIEQLTEAMHRYGGLPKYGLVFNHIASLEGPINRFYLAAQHGLGLIQSIFSRTQQHLGVHYHPSSDLALQRRLQASLSQRLSSLRLQQQRTLNMMKSNQQLLSQPQQQLQASATPSFIKNLELTAQRARTYRY